MNTIAALQGIVRLLLPLAALCSLLIPRNILAGYASGGHNVVYLVVKFTDPCVVRALSYQLYYVYKKEPLLNTWFFYCLLSVEYLKILM